MRERWRSRAACLGQPMTLFFPARGKKTSDVYAEGKAFCAKCPVKKECLKIADEFIPTGDRYGLYGGLSPRERREARSNGILTNNA